MGGTERRAGETAEALRARRPVETPDPFIPGQVIRVEDPDAILGSGHPGCPVCSALEAALGRQHPPLPEESGIVAFEIVA